MHLMPGTAHVHHAPSLLSLNPYFKREKSSWWTGLDSNQRTGNPGRFTVCCL